MRRSLISMVAATSAIVLIALLVPMAVLLSRFALEDRLARAALEVQATETVVSGQDKGSVSVYLDQINGENEDIVTTVLYPDGSAVGPDPGEDERVRQARRSGQARVDDMAGGAEILVPVSLGGGSALPENTPVVRVRVFGPGFGSDLQRSWLLLGLLGVILLVGSLLLADRLGRSFVEPVRQLAAAARRLSVGDRNAPLTLAGPPEVLDVAAALQQLVNRVEELLERERVSVANLSHRLRTPMTRLRLALDHLPPADRERLAGDLDELGRMVDDVVREARRSEREGLTARCDAREVIARRAEFWRPLAEDQRRTLTVELPSGDVAHEVAVRVSAPDLDAVLDALLDNAFSYTEDGVPIHVGLEVGTTSARLVVEDAGPGFPDAGEALGRGMSYGGSTGLGLDIVRRTAEAAAGEVILERSSLGGARVVVALGLVDEAR